MVPLLPLLVLLTSQGLISQDALTTAHKDLFAAALGAAEPSVAALNKLALPFTGKAVVGAPFATPEVGITPAGAALVPLGKNRLWIKMFVETDKGLVGIFDNGKRSFPDPQIPAEEHVAVVDGVKWRQKVFVSQELPGRERLLIRISCENISKEHRLLGPVVGFSVLDGAQGADEPPKAQEFTPHVFMYSVPLPENRYLMAWPRMTGVHEGGLPAPWMKHRVTLSRMAITPGDKVEWVVTVGLFEEPGPPPSMDIERMWKETQKLWADKLKPVVAYSVPEPGFNALRMELLAQLLLTANGDTMAYGAFPSQYDGQVFGVEEGWGILALAEWGLGADAMTLMDGTILSEGNLDKTSRHHQYRNGLAGMYAWSLYELTGDHVWIELAVDKMKAAAQWTKEQIGDNGILPEYNYGGDIADKAQALWPNACCWRGARDAGLALQHLKEAGGPEFIELAKRHRAKLVELFDHAAGRTGGFMPLSLGESAEKLPAPEYYQLFAPLIMETGLFAPTSAQAKDMLRFMESTGRLQAGIPRFSPSGSPGIDAEYAMGLQMLRLRAEDRKGFLLGLFGQLALSCDPAVSTMPEVTALLTTAQMAGQQRKAQEVLFSKTSEPVSAGPGVTLRYMRRMLVNEETDSEDIVNGTLQVCPAIPERWLNQTQPFFVKGLPTAYGKVSLVVTPTKSKVTYAFAWDGKGVYPLKTIRLRVPASTKEFTIKGTPNVKPPSQGWLSFGAGKSVTVTVSR
jgi:hypothetical protein